MSAQNLKKSKRFWEKLSHAFAVKDEEGFSPEELQFMEKVADFICRRRLEAAAIMGLVTVKPLGFLGSQLLIFLEPFLVPFFNEVEYHKLVSILSKREGIEVFVQLLEKKSAEKKKNSESQQQILKKKEKKN